MFSYILGNIESSPKGILINKTTGIATYTNFLVKGSSHPVPFRLTPLIISSFGTSGVKGPFYTELGRALKIIRKNSIGLAVCLQFAISDSPFEPSLIPNQFYAKFTGKEKEKSEIDEVYERIQNDKDNKIDNLIINAHSIINLAQMPKSWRAWW